MWIAVLVSDFANILLEQKKLFVGKSTIVEDIYNKYLALKKVKIKGVRKITITLETETGIDGIWAPIKGGSPVVNIRRLFAFDDFFNSTTNEQNEIIIQLIELSLSKAVSEFNWDKNIFSELGDKVRSQNFKQCYIEGKLKLSKNKLHKAGIEINMDQDYAKVSVVFYSSMNDSLIKRIELIKLRPSRFFINSFLGHSMWLNDHDFVVTNKTDEIHFKTTLLKDKADIYFTPVTRSKEKLVDVLLIYSAETDKNLAIDLINDDINSKYRK